MEVAHKKGLESVAFCSILYRCLRLPIERAAPLAPEHRARLPPGAPDTSLRRVVFAMFGAEEYRVFATPSRTLEKEGA